MKIVEIIPNLKHINGAENIFVNLCLELTKLKDVDLKIVTLYDEIDQLALKKIRDNNITFYSCHKHKGFDYKAARIFKKHLEKLKPDIVHMHLNCLLTYYLAYRFKRPKFKLFKTIHSVPQRDVSNKINYFISKKLVKKDILCLIGISKEITRQSIEFYKTNKIININNASTVFEKQNIQKDFTFICVARFSKQKNHKLLLCAFDKCFEVTPNITLALVGSGEEMADIKLFASTLKSSSHIYFLGQRNDIGELLNRSLFFILSSLYEGNPISILEAMSVGLPVIAPSVGGIPNIVIHNKNGYLFETNNIDDLVNKMKHALAMKNYNSISMENYKTARIYTLQHCAYKYISAFREASPYEKE